MKAQGTGFVVLKFYSFKVKNKIRRFVLTASKEYAGLFAAFDLGGMYGVLYFFV